MQEFFWKKRKILAHKDGTEVTVGSKRVNDPRVGSFTTPTCRLTVSGRLRQTDDMKTFVCVALILFSGILVASDILPATPHGRLAGQYLEAFNGGEATMRAFLEKSPTATPIDERLARYRRMKDDLGSLTPVRLVTEDAGCLQLVVRNKAGEELSLMLTFAPDKLQIVSLHLDAAGNGAPPANGPPETGPPEEAEKVLGEVRDLVEQRSKAGEFSGTVLVARGPDVSWQGAYGFANKEAQIANLPDTRFDVGSIAKSFTCVAIGQLIEQGKLQLTDKIGTYLPDYPNQPARERVTIEQLLDMRSGIGDFFGEKFRAANKDKIRTLSDYLPFFASEPLLFPPGAQQRYSNGGYIVLGLIIEKVTGQSYYDYVQKNVFERAGMKNSAFGFRTGTDPKQAIGYTTLLESGEAPAKRPSNPNRRPNLELMPARGSSAGSAQSTAADLFLYVQALAQGKLLSPLMLAKLDLHPDGMGIAGGAPGLNATLEAGIRSAGSATYAVVVMSNFDPPAAERLSEQIRALLRRAK